MDVLPRGRVFFHLLGPVEAFRDGVRVGLGAPQQRAVLVMLLLHEGRTVGMDDLIDGVWGDRAPVRARGAVRTYVARLRAALEPAREKRGTYGLLVSAPEGYALRTPDGSVDAMLFEREAATCGGDARDAYARLSRTLDRWRGSALAGVPGPYARRQHDRLTELRVRTCEELYGHALDLGMHTRAVAELGSLIAEFPLRERLYELMMLALYRSGRRAEALAVFENIRRGLRKELGVPPGAALTGLHGRVLAGDEVLAPLWARTAGIAPARTTATAPRAAAGSVRTAPSGSGPVSASRTGTGTEWEPAHAPAHAPAPAPRPEHPQAPPQQIPADLPDFTGRTALVGELDEVLRRGGDRGAVVVAVLSGAGGVGKTVTAVRVAHGLRDAFPDGCLHRDLGGGGTPADPAGVLADFLIALGVPAARVPLEREQRAALYRTVLAGRRALVVLDNARDAEQLRPLLPGTAGCAVLVTSRARDLAVAGAHHVDLDVPPEDEAVGLLAAVAGAERVGAEPEAARSLVAACGRLPLAVRIAAARLAARPGRTLASLDARLRCESTRLAELRIGGLEVEPTFRIGYEALSPDAARALRLLSLLDAPDLPLPVAAALLGCDERPAERLAESLVDAGMLEPYGAERYRFHDLLRVYARSRAEESESAAERDAALRRVLDLLLGRAGDAARTALPDESPALLPPLGAGGGPGRFAGIEEVRAWFGGEHATLAAAVGQSLRSCPGELRRTLDLLVLIVVSGLCQGWADHRELRRLAGLAAELAGERDDVEERARALHTRAWLSFVVARFEEAEADLRTALDCAEVVDSPLRRHMSGILLALVLWATDRPAEAETTMRRAARHGGDPCDPHSPASAARFTARLHVALGAQGPETRLAVLTPLMRAVDATGRSLITRDGLHRLGAELHRGGLPAAGGGLTGAVPALDRSHSGA